MREGHPRETGFSFRNGSLLDLFYAAGLTSHSYHDPTGAGVIRDRRPSRESNDRRTRWQIRLQLLRPRG